MVNIKFYLVTYDNCLYKAVSNLTDEERNKVYCYAVNPTRPKCITNKLKVINEWQLPIYESRFQFLNYYEYSSIPHITQNEELTKDLTHIGLLHNDVLFNKDSINNITKKLEETPDKIFYISKRKRDVLYFTKDQLKHLIEYMSPKLNINPDINSIWNGEWISEFMAIMPVNIFRNFGRFICKYKFELESMLSTNKWGLMDLVKHRNCGLIERLWGIYLVSCGYSLEQADIIHDRESYQHQHLIDKEKFLNNV